MGCLYIRDNELCRLKNIYKIGKTISVKNRNDSYITYEHERGELEYVVEIYEDKRRPSLTLTKIDYYLTNYLQSENNYRGGGREYYNRDLSKLIEMIEFILQKINIEYKVLTKEEISLINRRERFIDTFERVMPKFNYLNVQHIVQQYKIKKNTKTITNNAIELEPNEHQVVYNWNERGYQPPIIDYCKNVLLTQFRITLDLPTGGGKTYITYNIINYLNSQIIITISPRKIVNSQNKLPKNLQLLSDTHAIFEYSNDTNFDEFVRLPGKKILICCTQSSNKISQKLIENDITDAVVWFDEAHWGVEEWVNNLSNNVNAQFWLLHNRHIKYRIFTTATPNTKKILENERIFGELYSPINVKELIDLNWLSPMEPYVYSENKKNVNNIKHMLDDFNERERKYGFSFHNKQKNAFNLFYKHMRLYKNSKTHIKPFLLISDNFTIEKEPKLQEVILEYDYRNIKIYENTMYSMGYVVAKYSMGYDFNKLDFICLSDPKLSIQDIKQCIGRGIRSDELGENGLNKEKILVLSLPVYIDDNGDNKYDKIISVLQYLLYNIKIPFEKIVFKNRYIHNFKEREHTAIEYLGINDVKSVLLNLLEIENNRIARYTTYEQARKKIADKNIKSKQKYYELCDEDNTLSKEPDVVFRGKFTNWIEYLSIERIYYDLDTCKNKVSEYLLLYPKIKNMDLDLSNACNELCKIDDNFPPNGLWVEYYNVNELCDIITITIKKKKLGVIL